MSRVINYMENLTTFAYMNPTWASFPPFFASPNSLRVPDEKKIIPINRANQISTLLYLIFTTTSNYISESTVEQFFTTTLSSAEFHWFQTRKKWFILYTSVKTSSLERISESNRFCFLAQLFTDPSNAGFQPHFAFA